MTNVSESSFRSVCCLLHESSFIFCISDLFDFCCKQFWGCGHINGTYIACLLMSQDLTEGTCKKLCPFICRVMGLVQLIIYEGGCWCCKEIWEVFFLHTSCEVPFCTFISFVNFKQAESECKKKKKNYHSFAAYFKDPFFLLIKGVLKRKMQGSKWVHASDRFLTF